MFQETGKEIMIDPQNNSLVFHIKGSEEAILLEDGGELLLENGDRMVTEGTYVRLEQLSSGEKQILLILTSVFLQEEKPTILLMDEPEISLHISWQDRLISLIRELNPNCQLIVTTHSPNIFASGWEDKVVFVQDLEEL